jgi:hypothetical protein
MNVEKFDTRFFSYLVAISDSKGNKMPLTTGAIENLTITDNVLFPFFVGSITVNNAKNILQAQYGENKKNSIEFAGNNCDFVMIDIMPNVTGNLEQDCQDEKLKEIFNLRCICTINELQDSDEPAGTTNTMNFRSVYHQMALQSSEAISSDQLVAKQQNVSLKNLNNSERSAKTGDLLKELITKIYDKTEEEIIDVENFDLGANKIKWHSKGNSNAFQSLMYLSGLHQSEQNNDPCLLWQDRYTQKFKNIPISKLFELQKTEPEKYVLETFQLESGQAGGSNPSNIKGQGMQTMSNILEYKLTPINGDLFTRVVTNAVFYTTAPSDRNFCFDCKAGSIKEVYEQFTKLYVDPLKSGNDNIVPSIELKELENFNRLTPKIISTELPFNYNAYYRNKMLFTLLTCSGDNIVFRTIGSTHRQSGYFIDIGTTADIADTGVANNLLGRWFVVSVSHVFAGNSYYNIIEAVKTYKMKQN